MLYPDQIDVAIEVFGGYCPAVPPSDLAPGAASVVNDMIFPQGAVRTRGGLQNYFTGPGIPTTAQVNGLKSYITPTLAQRLLVWDSAGNLFKESPQASLNLVAARPYRNLLYQSVTLFGREYQAFSNGLGGFDIPRQFDDTNWDRVSQSGPGAAPVVVDEIATTYTITASPNGLSQAGTTLVASPNGLSEAGNLVTVNITGSGLTLFLKVGDLITIAGAGVAGYNGTWTVAAIVSPTQIQYVCTNLSLANSGNGTISSSVTTVIPSVAFPDPVVGQLVTIAGAGVAAYNGTWVVRGISNPHSQFYVALATSGNAASGNGTYTPAGSIVAGLHQVSVSFITRNGFITQAAVPTSWTAAGNKRATVGNIPIAVGTNVVARLLMFTPVITPPAVTGSFYSLPNGSLQIGTSAMLINDNTTTTLTVDFTDTILIAGFSCNYLFTQLELGESAFVIGYNSRLAWLGERNHVSNFVNLGFDGGIGTDGSGRAFPLGWKEDPTLYAGGGSLGPGFADWMGAYSITGDAATAVRGKMSQSAYQDYLGVPIIQRNTAYSVRARVALSGNLTQGTLHINLQSTSGAFTTAGLSVTAGQLTANYAEFIATLTDTPLATPPSDLVLQVYADGTPSLNSFVVDSIEVYPTNTPFNYSTARVSHAFNPESYDSVTGQIQVRPGDGQQLRAGFPLRNNLYLAKDHYLGYVADDGVNEPASWAFNEVSSTIGICGPNAVDYTEEWAVFAERSGLYLCWGSDPVKITPEIQTDATGTGKMSWDKINWSAANTIWVRIDKVNKMILIGAPTLAASTPNVVFVLDYRWLETAQDIASTPLITFSSFTGKLLSHGRGRRWAIWNISANSMTFAERSDGTAQPFFGSGGTFGVGTGKVYQQVDASLFAQDDGVAINWRYRLYGCPSRMEEQQFQLSAHRKLLGYLKWRVVGSGSLLLSVITALRTTVLRPYTMSTTPAGDGERDVNIHGERFFLEMAGNAVGTWGQIEQVTLCMKKDASIPVRGVSS